MRGKKDSQRSPKGRKSKKNSIQVKWEYVLGNDIGQLLDRIFELLEEKPLTGGIQILDSDGASYIQLRPF